MPIEMRNPMARLLIISREREAQAGLRENLTRSGLSCSITSYNNGVREAVIGQRPDVILLEMGWQLPDSDTWGIVKKVKTHRQLTVIALIP